MLCAGLSCGRSYLPRHEASDTAKMQIRMLEIAVDAYEMKNGRYPASLDDVREFMKGGELPQTPWRGEYQYAPTSTNEGFRYEIKCVKPDGRVLANWNIRQGANRK